MSLPQGLIGVRGIEEGGSVELEGLPPHVLKANDYQCAIGLRETLASDNRACLLCSSYAPTDPSWRLLIGCYEGVVNMRETTKKNISFVFLFCFIPTHLFFFAFLHVLSAPPDRHISHVFN